MSAADKIKAAAEEIAGKAKQAVGDVTDNDKLKAEGKADEAKGQGRGTVEDVKDVFKK